MADFYLNTTEIFIGMTVTSSDSSNVSTSLMATQQVPAATSASNKVPTLSLALAVLFLIESAIIIPLNVFTMSVIVTKRHQVEQSRVSRIMLSLLAADLSVGLVLPLHSAFFLIPSLATIRYLCLVRTACNYVSCIASVLSLLLVTTDRYVAIVHPYHYSTHGSLPYMPLCVAGAWIYALGFGAAIVGWNRWPTACNPETIMYPGLFVPFCACLVYASCATMALMYVKIFREASGQESRMVAVEQFRAVASQRVPQGSTRSIVPVENVSTSNSTDKTISSSQGQLMTASQMKRERKYAKVVGVVVAAFTLCWLPVVVILTLLNTGAASATMTMFYLRTAATVLFVSNSLINPVIYIWHMSGFRRHLRRLLHCHRKDGAVHPISLTTSSS